MHHPFLVPIRCCFVLFCFGLFCFVLFCALFCFTQFHSDFLFRHHFLLPIAALGPRRLRRTLPYIRLLCPRDTARQFHPFIFRLHAWTLPPPSRGSSSSPLSRPRFGWAAQRPPARSWSSFLRRSSFRTRGRVVWSNLPVISYFRFSIHILFLFSFILNFVLLFFFLLLPVFVITNTVSFTPTWSASSVVLQRYLLSPLILSIPRLSFLDPPSTASIHLVLFFLLPSLPLLPSLQFSPVRFLFLHAHIWRPLPLFIHSIFGFFFFL